MSRKKKAVPQAQIIQSSQPEVLDFVGSHGDCEVESASTAFVYYDTEKGRSPYVGNLHFKLRGPDPAWDLMS